MLLMFGNQNATRLIIAYILNDCQGVESGVFPHINKNDGQIRNYLEKLFILKRNINIATLSFALSASYHQYYGRGSLGHVKALPFLT